MKRPIAFVLAVLLIVALPRAFAGEAVTAFQPGRLPPEALPHLQVKAVVAEFLDPDNTQLGKEIGYLVWRELLTAISDQAGAGVIIAHPPGGARLVDLLQQNYHQAAIDIAASQKARMAVWGAVAELDGKLALDSYLSLVGDVVREELALRVNWADSPGAKQNETGLSARITRTRFNLPRVWRTADELFVRTLRVQANTAIREQPARTAKVLGQARAGATLQSEGMRGEWFRVRTDAGAEGYVSVWDVYVMPRLVVALDRSPVLERPAAGARALGTTEPSQRYAVSASRYIDKAGLWYEVDAPGGRGWVRGSQVRAQFSLPVVHFAAGLYRYQLGRYDEAAREFDQFTRMEGAREDAASLSTAYQLLAASQLMAESKARKYVTGYSGYERALRAAIEVTPYDSGAYALRSVATLATRQSVAAAWPDVQKALEYDPGNRDARTTLNRLQSLAVPNEQKKGASLPPRLFQSDLQGARGAALRQEIQETSGRYAAAPR